MCHCDYGYTVLAIAHAVVLLVYLCNAQVQLLCFRNDSLQTGRQEHPCHVNVVVKQVSATLTVKARHTTQQQSACSKYKLTVSGMNVDKLLCK